MGVWIDEWKCRWMGGKSVNGWMGMWMDGRIKCGWMDEWYLSLNLDTTSLWDSVLYLACTS